MADKNSVTSEDNDKTIPTRVFLALIRSDAYNGTIRIVVFSIKVAKYNEIKL